MPFDVYSQAGADAKFLTEVDGGDLDAAPLPITLRRGTTAERDASNPILAAGEPAVVLDSGQPAELVLGDGVTAMADLRAAVWDDDARLAAAGDAAQKSSNLSDLESAPTARSNLGLGTAAVADARDFAASGAAFATLRAALDSGRSCAINILSDSTGAGTGNWVDLLTQSLAAAYPGHTVKRREWVDATQDYAAPITVQTGPGGLSNVRLLGIRGVSAPNPGPFTDLDLRIKLSMDSYTTGTKTLMAIKSAGAFSNIYWFMPVSGIPGLKWSSDGGASQASTSYASTGPSFAAGTVGWLRVTLDVDNGAGGHTITHYTSTDGVAWTVVGSPEVRAGVTSVSHDASKSLEVGAQGLSGGPWPGNVYEADVRTIIGGPSIAPRSMDDYGASLSTDVVRSGAPTLEIINGSHPGAALTYLGDATRLPRMTPNYGRGVLLIATSHNDGPLTGAAFTTPYAALVDAALARLPNASPIPVTQNPRIAPAVRIDEQAIRRLDTMAWARSRGYGSVDAYRAFGTGAGLIGVDGVHPNGAGSAAWRDAILAEAGLL